MRKNSLISVIITNYNYAEYVGQAIESVLSQTYPNIELIIINDGSNDKSDKVIREYVKENSDIIYINQNNLGANAARNTGIELAKGDYIFLLDADNWLNPEHIEKLYNKAVSEDADVIYTDLQHFGDDDIKHEMTEFDVDYLKIANFVDTSSLIRKSSIGKNRFDMWLNRKFLQDYDFFLGLALRGLKFTKCSDVALNYRIHNKQHGNNQQNISKLKQSIENYDYIIKKYTKQHASEFGVAIKLGNDMAKIIIYLRKDLLELEQRNAELHHQNTKLLQENTRITNSVYWRITKPLRYIGRLTRRLIVK